MMVGRALLVTHPYRKDQDYVSLDIEFVAKDLDQSTAIGWQWRIRVITFKGDGALSILTTVDDVVDLMVTKDNPFTKKCLEKS